MINFIDFIKEHYSDILAIYGAIVALCTAVVKMTPSNKDDTIWGNIVKILDLFSTAFTDSDKSKLESKHD